MRGRRSGGRKGGSENVGLVYKFWSDYKKSFWLVQQI